MRRELPITNIKGTDFVVDVQRMLLYQKTDPGNVISIESMENMGTHYCFDYDLERKSMQLQWHPDVKNVVQVDMPPLVVLDPIGMSLKHNIPVAEVTQRDDISFKLNAEEYAWLKERTGGTLPTIDLAGDIFEIHVKQGQLINLNPIGSGIDLKEIEKDQSHFFLLGYYNTVTKQIVHVTDLDQKMPAELVPLKIPNEFALDLVGISQKYRKNDLALITFYPLTPKHQSAIMVSHDEMKEQLTKSRQMKRVVMELNLKYGSDRIEKNLRKVGLLTDVKQDSSQNHKRRVKRGKGLG
jgi:hypothetical protein